MSWDAYVTNNLVAGGITHGAISGHDGNLWAKSEAFPMTATELLEIIKILNMERPSGTMLISGCKYLITQGEKNSYMRMVTLGDIKSEEKLFYYCSKSKQALIIGGVTNPGKSAGNCSKVVQTLCDYLLSVGY